MTNRELEIRYNQMKATWKNLVNANVELVDENKMIKEENERLNNIIKNTIKELFELKDMIYKPETREINFDVQRKISSMIVKLGDDKE